MNHSKILASIICLGIPSLSLGAVASKTNAERVMVIKQVYDQHSYEVGVPVYGDLAGSLQTKGKGMRLYNIDNPVKIKSYQEKKYGAGKSNLLEDPPLFPKFDPPTYELTACNSYFNSKVESCFANSVGGSGYGYYNQAWLKSQYPAKWNECQAAVDGAKISCIDPVGGDWHNSVPYCLSLFPKLCAATQVSNTYGNIFNQWNQPWSCGILGCPSQPTQTYVSGAACTAENSLKTKCLGDSAGDVGNKAACGTYAGLLASSICGTAHPQQTNYFGGLGGVNYYNNNDYEQCLRSLSGGSGLNKCLATMSKFIQTGQTDVSDKYIRQRAIAHFIDYAPKYAADLQLFLRKYHIPMSILNYQQKLMIGGNEKQLFFTVIIEAYGTPRYNKPQIVDPVGGNGIYARYVPLRTGDFVPQDWAYADAGILYRGDTVQTSSNPNNPTYNSQTVASIQTNGAFDPPLDEGEDDEAGLKCLIDKNSGYCDTVSDESLPDVIGLMGGIGAEMALVEYTKPVELVRDANGKGKTWVEAPQRVLRKTEVDHFQCHVTTYSWQHTHYFPYNADGSLPDPSSTTTWQSSTQPSAVPEIQVGADIAFFFNNKLKMQSELIREKDSFIVYPDGTYVPLPVNETTGDNTTVESTWLSPWVIKDDDGSGTHQGINIPITNSTLVYTDVTSVDAEGDTVVTTGTVPLGINISAATDPASLLNALNAFIINPSQLDNNLVNIDTFYSASVSPILYLADTPIKVVDNAGNCINDGTVTISDPSPETPPAAPTPAP